MPIICQNDHVCRAVELLKECKKIDQNQSWIEPKDDKASTVDIQLVFKRKSKKYGKVIQAHAVKPVDLLISLELMSIRGEI